MSRYKVLVTDYAWPSLEIERGVLAAVDAELVVAASGAAHELVALAADVDAILTCWKPVPVAALDAASRCLIVSRYGIGLDNIPVDHATALGILVTNVPDFCLEEVSNHALALLMACNRRVVAFARATAAGEWDLSLGRTMPRLAGQTLGLIGYGNIARSLATKARALGLHILAYTPRLPTDTLAPWGVATNDLAFLLRSADYVSIHVPLTEATRGLIDATALRTMKPTAYLINTSRGAVIDEDALVRALAEGWIAGAALDVLTQEPPPPDHPLLRLDNVIVTPHAAFYSTAAIAELARKAAERVAAVLRGELPPNVVNSSLIGQTHCRLKVTL